MSGAAPIICDTSGLLAAADSVDPDHRPAANTVATASGPLIVSPLVAVELDYLLRARLSADAARTFGDDLAAGAYELAPLTHANVAGCLEVDRQYASLGLGLTDAHLVVLAHDYSTDLVFSLDERHLRAVRPLRGHGALRLLPADG